MDLSVVIPCFNAGERIVKCIESVAPLNESINLEVIVVDDGSDDNSAMLVKELNLPFVKLISQENSGAASARNKGIENAAGKYLVFADCDDYFNTDELLEVYKKAEKLDSDMLIFGYNYVTKNRIRRIPVPTGNLKKQMVDFPFAKRYESTYLTGRVYQYIYKREKLKARFDTGLKYAEDLVFVLDCLSDCKKPDFCDIYAYNYIFNETSLSNVYRPHYYDELKTVYETLVKKGYTEWNISYLYYMDRALKNYVGKSQSEMKRIISDEHLLKAIENNDFRKWTIREKWRNSAVLADDLIGVDAYYTLWKVCNTLRFSAVRLYTKLRLK